jgi:hypothetical protein
VKSHQLRRRDRREAPHQHAHGLVRGLPSQHQPHHHRIVHRLPPSTLAAPPLQVTTCNAWENTKPPPWGSLRAQQPATASSTFSTSSPGSSAHPPAVTVFCRCPRARYRNGFVESAARRPSARPHARGPRPHPSLRLGGTRNVTVACDGGAGAQAGVRHKDGRTPCPYRLRRTHAPGLMYSDSRPVKLADYPPSTYRGCYQVRRDGTAQVQPRDRMPNLVHGATENGP